MRKVSGTWLGKALGFGALLTVGCALTVGPAGAQATQSSATAQPGAAVPSQTHTVRHRTRRRRTASVQTLPIEKASPAQSQSPQAAAAAEAQQRAADARLLKQQEAQSERDAAVNDKMVQRAQQRQDAQQDQIRIQDAPGPAQTGVVPAAGPPVQPAQTDQRIQDQPSQVPGNNTNPPQG